MPVPGNVIGTAVLELSTDHTKLLAGLRASEAAARSTSATMTKIGVAIGAALVGGLALSSKAAIDFESSFAGVRKTVDGTDAELDAIASAFRKMATEIPVNVNELNRIGEAAGQVGVSKENIVAFTETMAMLGATTNIVAEDAATEMARFMNVMNSAPDSVDELASVLVRLGNEGASTEQEILALGGRIAGAAQQAGMAEQDVLGFANALSSMGIQAEAGGTSFSRVISTMQEAVINAGDDLEAFAEIAGMASDEFAALFKENPSEAIIAFAEGLGRISSEGGNVYATLDQIGLSEARVTRVLLALAGNTDLVKASLASANDEMGKNTALTTEFGKRAETTASQLQVARNRINDMAISLGQQLLPAIGDVAGAVGGIAEAFGALPQSTQNLILLTGAAVALAPVLVSITQKAQAFFAAMQAGSLSARASVGLMAGSLGLVLVAVDQLLNATTGKGLWDTFWGTGSDEKARATADAVRQLGYELENIPEPEQLPYIRRELDGLVESARPAQAAMDDVNRSVENADSVPVPESYGEIAGDLEELEARAKAMGVAMLQSGAPVDELAAIIERLRSEGLDTLADAFAEGSDFANQWAAAQQQAAAATKVAADQAEVFGPTLEQLTAGTQSAADAFSASVEPVGDFADESERAEAAAKLLDEALQRLIGTFSDFNPRAMELRFENARLTEALDDMVRSGETWNETLGMSREQIEATIAANSDLIAGYDANKGAIEAFLPFLQQFVGEEGFGRLVAAMREAGQSDEQIIDALGRIGESMTNLQQGSLTAAVEGFESLKTTLGDTTAWSEIAGSVEDDLVGRINAAFDDGLITAEQAEGLKTRVKEAVGGAVDGGVEEANSATEIGDTAMTQAGSGIDTGRPGFIDKMRSAVQGAVDEGTSTATGATASGQQLTSSGGEGIDNGREGLAQKLVGAFQDSILRAIDAATGATQAGEQLGTSAAGGIDAMTLTVEDAARQLMLDAGGAAAGATGGGYDAGFSFGSGIGQGIRDAVNVAANAAAYVAQEALDAAMAVIRPGSPSKTTEEEIGRPFTQGIAFGIAREAGAAAAVAAETASAIAYTAIVAADATLQDGLKRFGVNVPTAASATATAYVQPTTAVWPQAPESTATLGGPRPGATKTVDGVTYYYHGENSLRGPSIMGRDSAVWSTSPWMGGAAQMAAGGLATRPVLSWIGEGAHDEIVMPLRRGMLRGLLDLDMRDAHGLGDSIRQQVFNATINIAGNADAGVMRDALETWWRDKLQFEFTVAARRDGIAF